jgi:hypothetical protein
MAVSRAFRRSSHSGKRRASILLSLCLLRVTAALQCGLLPGCLTCRDRPPELGLAKLPGYKHGMQELLAGTSQGSFISKASNWLQKEMAAAQAGAGAGRQQLPPLQTADSGTGTAVRQARGLLSTGQAALRPPMPEGAVYQQQQQQQAQQQQQQWQGSSGSAQQPSAMPSVVVGGMPHAASQPPARSMQGQGQGAAASQQAGGGKPFNILPFLAPPTDTAPAFELAPAAGLSSGGMPRMAQPPLMQPLQQQPLQQAQPQVLNVLVTDPRNHTGPHPWDVLLFKTNQFNTTRPAYRLGGLGLMLMTDFNQSRPLTDWHVLQGPAAAPQQAAGGGSWGAAQQQPSAGSSAVPTLHQQSFVDGVTLVKPGLTQVQEPAHPLGWSAHQQQLMHQQQWQQQVLQIQQQQQQQAGAAAPGKVAGRQYAAGSAGSTPVAASRQAGTPAAAGQQQQQQAGPPHKQGSLVSQLVNALRDNMRMVAPRLQAAAEALTGGAPHSSGAGTGGSSSSSSSGGGVMFEQGRAAAAAGEGAGGSQLWCTACQQPAYQLTPFGHCGE